MVLGGLKLTTVFSVGGFVRREAFFLVLWLEWNSMRADIGRIWAVVISLHSCVSGLTDNLSFETRIKCK